MVAWLLAPFLAACIEEPLPSPAEAAVEADLDRATAPPLYRKLYDYAFAPEVQLVEQKVRLRIWLRYMDFDRYQLGMLEELISFARREFEAIDRRHAEIVGGYEPEVRAVYAELWAAMDRGANDDELGAIGNQLDVIQRRQDELLALRAQSVRTLLAAEQPFLKTFTPQQDTYFADAIFALRHRLDPYANPGDFAALVGRVYVAGEFGTLTEPTYRPDEDHLNIGGLWSKNPEKLAGPYFQDARREVVLYMLLLEPALPEAVAAVKAERARKVEGARAEPPATPAPPPAAEPSPPPP
ncbi:MAG: hypothetical protein FJ090_14185 [Deltaproteobacteria bacterium]|nr:hypothetical protein [Deltaproteobacteria bacterium]